ncbi:MAG: hypothetical protein ACOY0T_09795 [Myxococcota bacterium]
MSKSRVWHSAVTLFFATAVSLSLSVGCSKQGEGERCDQKNAGDTDCDDGLICTNVSTSMTSENYRCCPPEGAAIGDSRCQRTGVSGTGGQSNSGGSSSGGSSNGGSSSGGNANGGAGDAGAASMSGGQSSNAGAEGT